MGLRGLQMEETESSATQTESDDDFEISYVMEPFERLNPNQWLISATSSPTTTSPTTSSHSFNVTLQDGAMFGNSSLRLDFSSSTARRIQVGVLQPETPHTCREATYMSLWYKQLTPMANNTQVRLILVDDNGDPTQFNRSTYPNHNATRSWESYYVSIPLSTSVNETDWQQLQVTFDQFQPLHARGNGVFDLHRLRGWKIEISQANSTTTSTKRSTLLVDHLACVGGPAMMGAGLTSFPSWEQAIDSGAWDEIWYQSPMAENQSHVALDYTNGALSLDYTVEMVESWGGFLSLDNMAVGPAYYNLSQANTLSLGYKVRQPASVPGRTHLRVMLADASDVHVCAHTHHCNDQTEDWEWWYSFHYVLDEVADAFGEIHMPLRGGTNSSAPFWLTGWSGGIGNRQFDKEYIKGFNIEISMDSQGELGSTVNGSIDLYNLTAYHQDQSTAQQQQQMAVRETDISFHYTSQFQKKEFQSSQCEATCAADPDCRYGFFMGAQCYMASYLEATDIGIPNTLTLQQDLTTFWIDDATKRGDFCDLCDCQPFNRTIDCRDRNLVILPKTFQEEWTPLSLDLRNNSNLVFIGKGSLEAVASSLQEIWLPAEMRHISYQALQQLPQLTAIHTQADQLATAISSDEQGKGAAAFGDICCSVGEHLPLAEPSGGLSFCNMKVKHPGDDATYYPFVEFPDGAVQSEVRPSSPFMAEAAESPEKCAEYCAISKECNFFGFDGRFKNAELLCYLFETMGSGPQKICCEEDHFGDEDGTIPGWTSGLPPRTRHTMDNAKVLIEPQAISIETSYEGYGEASFDLQLGSRPHRGAVWIEPQLASSTPMEVTFDPPRVVLYDANSTVRVKVTVAAADMLGTGSTSFVVQNKISSCDSAFVEYADDSTATRETTIFVDIVIPVLVERETETSGCYLDN
ncbi:expressed unknown protein [Seminavis robusta]|uniref:Uncharacterized protein n=1 Tax=Seminavis robusta TaxID=568900 RepID=A0A9N8F4K8_9STRA|nr:expressed unknown protein [Seminavis robusta]|eukprot:Sro2911_g340140.1 n/a (918) ;mRNA; f:7646-10482